LTRIRDKDDWTEDQDFFGIGIAIWTTNTVERFNPAGADPTRRCGPRSPVGVSDAERL
jgi:hypothetical protein